MTTHPKNKRPGLSLLEVLLSLAIMAMSLAALSYLMSLSTESALRAKHLNQASLYASSKLAEVRIGAIALQSQPEQTLDDDDAYMWSLDVEDGSYQGLKNVKVKVWRMVAGERVQSSLTQVILDPQFLGSSQDGSGTNSTTQAESSSSTTTPSSGSGSTTPSTTPAASPAPSAPRLGGGGSGSGSGSGMGKGTSGGKGS